MATKVKLTNGTIITTTDNDVVLENGVLKIHTTDNTVEGLAELFSNKENTAKIVLMTESETEIGYKIGFTSFAGITYNPDGEKTVELFQPVDELEARLSTAEGNIVNISTEVANTNTEINNINTKVANTNAEIVATNTTVSETNEQVAALSEAVDSMLTEIIPSLSL